MAKVNARVTDRVTCVFHAPITFSLCRRGLQLFKNIEPSTSKEASKTEKLKTNLDQLGCVPRPSSSCFPFNPILGLSAPSTN